jgi:hypothetical protein
MPAGKTGREIIMNIRMAAVAACMAALGGSPARADIIEAVFIGVVIPSPFGAGDYISSITGAFVSESTLYGLPFTATFQFDTDKGVLSHPSSGMSELVGGLVSASFLIQNDEGSFALQGIQSSRIDWANDFSTALARASDFFGHQIVLSNPNPTGANPNGFTDGTCPGKPCGFLQTDSVTVSNLSAPSPVPGPLVGTGLPGVLFGLLAAMRMYRRRSARCPDQ